MKQTLSPTPVLVLIGLVFVALVIRGLARGSRRGSRDLIRPWPLRLRPTVLSPVEQVLHRRLVEALPEHVVFGQVSLRQLVDVHGNQRNWALINRFDRLSVDFLVMNKGFVPVVAIELDDASHTRADRQDADARKAHALASAGLPLIRWTAKALPTVEAIRNAVFKPSGDDLSIHR